MRRFGTAEARDRHGSHATDTSDVDAMVIFGSLWSLEVFTWRGRFLFALRIRGCWCLGRNRNWKFFIRSLGRRCTRWTM